MSTEKHDAFIDQLTQSVNSLFPEGKYPPYLRAEFDQTIAACREAGFDTVETTAVAIMAGVDTFCRRFGQRFIDQGMSHEDFTTMMVNVVCALTIVGFK